MSKTKTQITEEFDLVIFGGDGDLSYRKIFPALYHRLNEGQINANARILAISRTERTQEEFKKILEIELKKYIPNINNKILKQLLTMVTHGIIDTRKNNQSEESKLWFESATFNIRVFYLATPAAAFGPISEFLDEHNYITENSRVVLEKPLGRDLKSSEEVNDHVARFFEEDQIYRIDHYLGKETVQNLMVLRFANNIFERSWNAQEIDNVQITVAESLGVGSRGKFYDQYGALRDMVQNHLLQLLCLITMEPPVLLDASEVRDEKLKVLKALRPYNRETIKTDTVRGQYTRGNTDEGHLPSYLEEIDKYESETETFVALKTYIDNWRWGGVPIYLRTGKRLPHRYSEIAINFKKVPHNIFPEKKEIENNRLTIRLQPEERIELRQMVKIPGPGGYRYKPFSLELDYADHFEDRFPDAYERLLMDVVRGNQTLFMRRDEVKASWEWIESILDNWKAEKVSNKLYEAGKWGPGDRIMEPGQTWVKSRHVLKVQEKKRNLKSRSQIEDELSTSIAYALEADIRSQGYASLLVSGGSTPRGLFKKLSTINIDWEKVTILLVDERFLKQNHKDQNGNLIKAHLLQNKSKKAFFAPLVIHDTDSTKNLDLVRKEVAKIKRPFSAVVLGMGNDGHTASLFPDCDELDLGMDLKNKEDLIITHPKSAPYERITFTRKALLNSKNLYLHIYGEEKKKIFDMAKEKSNYRPYPIEAFIHQEEVELELFWTK